MVQGAANVIFDDVPAFFTAPFDCPDTNIALYPAVTRASYTLQAMVDHSENFQNIASKLSRNMAKAAVPLGEKDVNIQSSAPKVSLSLSLSCTVANMPQDIKDKPAKQPT